jgi:hypothetical protein
MLPSAYKVKKVKLFPYLTKHYTMKVYGGVDVQMHTA